MTILIKHGFDGMDQAMAILVNEAMKIERAKALEIFEKHRFSR